MRTQEEIVAKLATYDGFFGGDLFVYALSFDNAKPHLKENVTAERWEVLPGRMNCDDDIRREIAEYMDFAWGKIEDHRGISAGRSVENMGVWLWLLGDDDTLAKFDAAPYPNYGAPKLAVVCEAYGLPIPDAPTVRSMIDGMSCVAYCDQGCG